MNVGDQVKCFFTMRRSKAYAAYGPCAVAGDTGVVVAINEKKDVTIVQFKTERGVVHCHIQNLIRT